MYTFINEPQVRHVSNVLAKAPLDGPRSKGPPDQEKFYA